MCVNFCKRNSNSKINVPYINIRYSVKKISKLVSSKAVAVHIKIPNFAWSITKALCVCPTQEGIFACTAAALEDTNLEKILTEYLVFM